MESTRSGSQIVKYAWTRLVIQTVTATMGGWESQSFYQRFKPPFPHPPLNYRLYGSRAWTSPYWEATPPYSVNYGQPLKINSTQIYRTLYSMNLMCLQLIWPSQRSTMQYGKHATMWSRGAPICQRQKTGSRKIKDGHGQTN